MTNSKKNIHVLFVDHESTLGGAELSMVDIIRNTHGPKLLFSAAIPSSGELEHSLKLAGAKKISFLRQDSWRWWEKGIMARFKLLLSLPIQLLNVYRWYKFFKKEKPDIIHFNLTRIIEPIIAGKLAGIHSVVHFREDPITNNAFLGGNFLLFKFLSLTDFWIANSITTSKYIQKYNSDKNTTIIPNGIDINKFKFSKVNKRKKFTVLKLAGLIKWKNHELFLKIAKEVNKINPEINFIIAGRGEINYENYLKKYAIELGIQSNVEFCGFVLDTVNLLNEIHLLLHTSHGETFGRVYVEAMSCSIPVIATKGGATDEIIENGKTGFTFHDYEIQNIANKIIELSNNNELCASIGVNGRISVENNYSMEQLSNNMRHFYKTILNTKNEQL